MSRRAGNPNWEPTPLRMRSRHWKRLRRYSSGRLSRTPSISYCTQRSCLTCDDAKHDSRPGGDALYKAGSPDTSEASPGLPAAQPASWASHAAIEHRRLKPSMRKLCVEISETPVPSFTPIHGKRRSRGHMADKAQPPDSSRRGHSDVQIAELVVHKLFGKYDHKVALPISAEDNIMPSVVILYGLNGIGKTTVLRMFDGLMRLDFDVFREVPFGTCYLDFNTGQRLQVIRRKNGLHVTFDDHAVILNSELGAKGALNPNDAQKVEDFRTYFFSNVENVSFNFIQANRAELFQRREIDYHRELLTPVQRRIVERQIAEEANPRALADRVKQFISDAQLDSEAFFLTSEPGLFNKVIDDLSQPELAPRSVKEIRDIFNMVHKQDERLARLGLSGDRWDYQQVRTILAKPGMAQNTYTRTVLSTYANLLASRAQARDLIAERLLTFEQVMNEFLLDKTVRVDAMSGITIYAGETRIKEYQLSSGEHQLLYLMVAALTTRRKGTVIAIDEPELSMHIAWQRKLLPNLIRCASNAAPQFVLATHSPDIATRYSENMVELSKSI
jgi:ABC-type phosphate/phosphonate transport system ATPase subunit